MFLNVHFTGNLYKNYKNRSVFLILSYCNIIKFSFIEWSEESKFNSGFVEFGQLETVENEKLL